MIQNVLPEAYNGYNEMTIILQFILIHVKSIMLAFI